MVMRSRDRRRRGNRSAGILRTRDRATKSRASLEHSQRRQGTVAWRIFSAFIVVCLILVLFVFFSSDAFYVRSVAVGGLQYLTKEEVFAMADIANVHVFWLDPAEIRENIRRSPSVADVRVFLTWPPKMVQIVVEEREPALVWEEQGTAYWIDLQGRVMSQREERSDLMRIVSESDPLQPLLSIDAGIPLDVVNGALQLRELLPDIVALRYLPEKGLGIKNANGWDVWFGAGTGMPEKISIYQTIAANLQARGVQPGEVNVVNPDAPFYTVLWGR